MGYSPGSTYYCEFTTSNFATGAAANATGTPAVTVNRNGADDATFSGALTVALVSGATGRYSVSGTIPSGYAVADVLAFSAAATVGGVAAVGIIDQFTLVASTPSVDLTKIMGVTITGTAAQIAAGFTKLFDVATPIFALDAAGLVKIWDTLTSNIIVANSIGVLVKLLGTTGIVVTPVSATAASSIPIASNIKIAQGAKQRLVFTVTDYQDNPVDLSGLTPTPGFRFTVFDSKLPNSLICKVESGNIAVSGGSGNIVTVTMLADVPTTPGSYSFNLWSLETTPGVSKDEQLWGKGTAVIEATNYGD